MYTLWIKNTPIVSHEEPFSQAFKDACESVMAHQICHILTKNHEEDVRTKASILKRVALEQIGIFFGWHKIDSIKLVRSLLDCGLGAAKEIAEFAETVKVEYSCTENNAPVIDDNSVIVILN